ncbi:hypothetical protein GN244_ATG16417 [Phytophthora infestans]|nr:hypothetical protein GN244_ATG16417 [Phytophthora infestans]
MVGSLSFQHKKTLPHHTALETTAFDLVLTDRQKQQLERQGLNLDALNVVAFHAKSLVIPRVATRSSGSFATPIMTDGILLTKAERKEAFSIHSEIKAMQTEDRLSHRLRKFSNKQDADLLKLEKKRAAEREPAARRAMRLENLAAQDTRRNAKREEAAQFKAEREATARRKKEVLAASRSGHLLAKRRRSNVGTAHKRRALQDITAVQLSIQNASV